MLLNQQVTDLCVRIWPYSYQFYLCNPVKVFEAIAKKANKNPEIEIKHLVPPDADRGALVPEPMPTSLLNMDELKILSKPEHRYAIEAQLEDGKSFEDFVSITTKKSINKHKLKETLTYINESTKALLSLRDTDKIAEEKQKYKRR